MAQDSPAKPLLDLRDKLYSAADKFLSYDKPINKKSTQKSDTSWHDGMVKQANESFRKSATTSGKPAAKPKVTRKKVSAKR